MSFINRKLARLERAWANGNAWAVSAAVEVCSKHQCAPPPWVVAGIKAIVTEYMRESARGERGRHSSREKRQLADRIHYTRWDAVAEWRDRRDELDDIAKTWEAAYAAVSNMLEGTEAAGGEDAIKKSYQKVQRAMRDGKAGRFHQVE